MMNKRGFLLSAASAVAAPQVLAAAAPAPGELAADGLPVLAGVAGLKAWQPYQGQRFELSDGRQCWLVDLHTIDALPQAKGHMPTEQFVLGFAQPAGAAIAAGTYRLEHANGQSALIHLAPAEGATRASLRAEFNLLQQPV